MLDWIELADTFCFLIFAALVHAVLLSAWCFTFGFIDDVARYVTSLALQLPALQAQLDGPALQLFESRLQGWFSLACVRVNDRIQKAIELEEARRSVP